jgi:PAS domain S-box-containing protein
MTTLLQAFRSARSDVDHVSWLDPFGGLRVSWPQNAFVPGAEFSPPDVIQRARTSSAPVFEVGIAAETTLNAGVIIAQPARDSNGTLIGIVAASLSLVELSVPLKTVVEAQQRQGRQLMISIIDDRGRLIATPNSRRILWTVLDELPGADQALNGSAASNVSPGPDGQDWLLSAVPVPNAGWAVIVQRPTSEALAVVEQFHLWLLIAALLFAVGGLLFWLLLLLRVIRPLHTLARQHQTLPASAESITSDGLALRGDEVGDLARSLVRLERDGLEKLAELRTLLETSNAVVSSLEPRAVVSKIIAEVRRLVNVQAAAVLLPDEQGVLHVLVSDGHSPRYNEGLSLSPQNISSSAISALRDGKPVQKLLGPWQPMPSLSYDEGFRSVLAIPIISRHAGGVVLLVHRTEPRSFNQNEIDLLLTFANYATLAWEHAVLYERSDERLREVARENEQLYQQASEEKQKLEAIMESMSDGLILTGTDGTVLYANMGATTIAGLPGDSLENQPIHMLYDALCAAVAEPIQRERLLASIETSADSTECLVEIQQNERRRALHLRQFAVGDISGRAIGRGLLLRDVTREREVDEFKTTLLAAVGHELRTPLAAIKGHASTLLQEDVSWSQADQRHFLQTISSEADRLALLVSNLLDLARQEAGLLLLRRSPARVQDIVDRIIKRLSPEAALSVAIPADLPSIDIDSARIEIVLSNLIANSLLYGGNQVCITAEQCDESMIISVADNGPGIADDELPHVFERFYRARQSRQHHSGGTGLGLAISKAFIEAHEGHIWAESSTQGTKISFSLPLSLSLSSSLTPPEPGEMVALSSRQGGRSL